MNQKSLLFLDDPLFELSFLLLVVVERPDGGVEHFVLPWFIKELAVYACLDRFEMRNQFLALLLVREDPARELPERPADEPAARLRDFLQIKRSEIRTCIIYFIYITMCWR